MEITIQKTERDSITVKAQGLCCTDVVEYELIDNTLTVVGQNYKIVHSTYQPSPVQIK